MGQCGTNPGGVSYPGDPVYGGETISAESATLGIHVWWTLPGIRPEAVTHMQLFRNTEAVYETAAVIASPVGSHYLDESVEVDTGTEFFYWIRFKSINGTWSDPIGPASSVMQPAWEAILDLLKGRLDASTLNDALRTDIFNSIDNIQSGLGIEEEARLLGDNVITEILQGALDSIGDIGTAVGRETIERQEADSAVAAAVDFLIAKFKQDTAAAITREDIVYADPLKAISQTMETLSVETQDGVAALQIIQGVEGGPDGLAASFTLITDVNGHVSGFGTYNDGVVSEFIVSATRFAVATPGENPQYPFIIDKVNGETKIILDASTFIKEATISNAMIGNSITSDDYKFGEQGWGIFKDFFGFGGYAEFNNVKVRGDIEATSIKAGTADIVDTLSIQGNALVVPSSGSGGARLVRSNEEYKLCSTQIEIPDLNQDTQSVVINWFVNQAGQNSNARSLEMQLWRGQTLLWRKAAQNKDEWAAGCYMDSPPQGVHTYELRMSRIGNSGNVNVYASQIVVTVVKK